MAFNLQLTSVELKKVYKTLARLPRTKTPLSITVTTTPATRRPLVLPISRPISSSSSWIHTMNLATSMSAGLS